MYYCYSTDQSNQAHDCFNNCTNRCILPNDCSFRCKFLFFMDEDNCKVPWASKQPHMFSAKLRKFEMINSRGVLSSIALLTHFAPAYKSTEIDKKFTFNAEMLLSLPAYQMFLSIDFIFVFSFWRALVKSRRISYFGSPVKYSEWNSFAKVHNW